MSSFSLLGEAARAEEAQFDRAIQLVGRLSAMLVTYESLGISGDLTEAVDADRIAASQAALARRLDALRETSGVTEVIVVDLQGNTIVASPSVRQGLPWSATTILERCSFQDVRAGDTVLTPVLVPPSGPRVRAYCAPVMTGDDDVVAAVAIVSEASYVATMRTAEFSTRGRVVGLSALVGLMVILGFRLILGPVQQATEAADRMADGERGVRVPAVGPSELKQLARAINELGNAVDAREDEVRGRLGAMSQLTSMVAHEIRNPLQSLSLLVTLARTERDAEERDQLLSSIDAEIHVLEGVVQKFLRSSGPVQISRVSADLVELVAKAVHLTSPGAKARGVEIITRVPDQLPMHIDASLVRRALENLVLNALEFSSQEPGGRVQIIVERAGKTALVIVDDTGPGVPPAERERIFKPYYSSKAGGTGLGLALVKQVFDAHGGNIRCETSPIGGARFRAVIPIEESLEVPFVG